MYISPNRQSFTRLLVFLFALSLGQVCSAATVRYAITADFELDNNYGGWGGDFPAEYDQISNYTIEFLFDSLPYIVRDASSSAPQAYFYMQSMQLFDNDRHLRSRLIIANPSPNGDSNLSITYGSDASSPDNTTGINRAPAGFFFTVLGDFGEPGDPLPYGPEFDELVGNSEYIGLSALYAQFEIYPDKLLTVAGNSTVEDMRLARGTFTFSSTIVPVPAAFWLFSSGFLSLFVFRKLNMDI